MPQEDSGPHANARWKTVKNSISDLKFDMPEFWLEAPGVDAFLRAFASFRSTNQGLADLLEMTRRNPDAKGSMESQIRKAIKLASFVVPESSMDELIAIVAQIYVSFERTLRRSAEEEGDRPRPVHVAPIRVTPAPECGEEAKRFKVVVEVTTYNTASIDGDQIAESLTNPLINAIAPFVTNDADPATCAAELGLNIALVRRPLQIQLEALLVSAVSSWEAFLSDVIREVCELDNNALRGSPVRFTALDVIDAKAHSDLMNRIREGVVTSSTRNFPQMGSFMKSVAKVEIMNESIREIVEARNVIVHHAGHVSQQYLDSCSPTGYHLGDRIVISEWSVRRALKELNRLALDVITACREKYRPQ